MVHDRPRVIAARGDAGRPLDAVVIDWRDHAVYAFGQPVRRAMWRPTTPQLYDFKVAAVLLSRPGLGFITRDEIAEAAFGDLADGGPLNVQNTISVAIARWRDAFASCAMTIERRYLRGIIVEWMSSRTRAIIEANRGRSAA